MPLTEPAPTQPPPARYAPDLPLPPYRYVPGLNPHPIKHPDGHLHGARAPEVSPPPADGWSTYPLHRYACDLFHHAYWWEAHEAWEAIWHAVPRGSPEWVALRGLIQTAAALLKRHVGHSAAAAILRKKACAHFDDARDGGRRVLGLSCEDVATALDQWFDGGPRPILVLAD